MTKKTNSLLLRYGVSLLWKQKNFYWTRYLLLEKLIRSVLKYYNYNILKISYASRIIVIHIYNRIFQDTKLYALVNKLYKKKWNLVYLIQKFGIGYKQLSWILSLTLKNTTIVKYSVAYNNLFFYLEYKKIIISILLALLKKIKTTCKVGLVPQSYFFLYPLQMMGKIKKYSLFLMPSKRVLYLQLRKIQGILKLNVIKFILAICIFLTVMMAVKIHLKNVFLIKGLSFYPVMLSIVNKNLYRSHFFTIMFSTFFFSTELLAEYIVILISKGKQHLKILKRFILFFEILFHNNLLWLQGCQLRVTGKLSGKMRASKYHYKLGLVCLQQIETRCSYHMSYAFTKYGVMSIKLWFLKKNAIICL